MIDQQYMTISQVAAHFGMSYKSVWRWVREKLIYADHFGNRKNLIPTSEVKRFVPPYRSTGRGRPPLSRK